MVSAGTPTAAATQAHEEQGALPRWLLALERAHAQALRAARTLEATPSKVGDLAPAARPIEEALAALYGAFDRRADPLAATRDAETALDRAVAALGPLAERDRVLADASAWLRDARKVLGVAEERFARVPPELPEIAELRASGDVPTLHRLERPSIAATIRLGPPPDPEPAPLPPPLPPPTTPAELTRRVAELADRAEARRREAEARRAERRRSVRAAPEEPPDPPPGFARGRFAALTEPQRLAARLRDCFEEVAMIGMQRAPLLGDPWRTALVLERRMLRAIDAIAALGPAALARIEPMVLDAPAKDPSRGFAAAMILGSFDGRDALGAAERILRHLGPADPEVAASFAGALKLVPHPALPVALRTWLGDADGAVRALAVDVLAYRGWITPSELFAAAADPSPVVVAAALPALGLSRPPDLAALLEGPLAHAEPAVREAAWTALALAGHPRAAEALEAEVFSPAGSRLASRAAVALAIVAEDREASRLIEAMRAEPTSALVVAAGWTGSPEAVPALIEVLRHKDAAIQLSAAYALERITGARLYEDVLVPPEKIDVPEVEEPDVGDDEPAPLARVVSDPRDLPSDGAADVMSQPTVRVERWMAHWRDRGPSYKPAARYRRGRPYTPRVSLFELDALPLTPAERRLLQRELVVRTAQHVRFDPHDFVEVQVESLRAWGPIAEATSSTPGSWARPIRRS